MESQKFSQTQYGIWYPSLNISFIHILQYIWWSLSIFFLVKKAYYVKRQDLFQIFLVKTVCFMVYIQSRNRYGTSLRLKLYKIFFFFIKI